MEQFAGRTAVVTGAGSGIGRALALHAAGEGMRVVVADVEAAALAETAAMVRTAGAPVLAVPTDVRDPGSVEALAAAADERFGGTHLLCNNAGVFQGGITWQRTLADWGWVMAVNFWGVLHGLRAFVPRLLAQEAAGDTELHIVNTSSMAGLTTVAFSSPYVVSKFAAAALTECLAHDLRAQGSRIGVSCLVPGAVGTRIADAARNRPDEPPSETDAPDAHMVAGALREMLAARGIPPAAAAAIVFRGIRARQFWISTTEAYEALLQQRNDALLERRLPESAQYA